MKTSEFTHEGESLVHKQNEGCNIECSSGRIAPYVYINRNCGQSPFACEDKACNCHVQHKKCIKAQTTTILQNLLQGDFSSQHISNSISNYFDSAIDQLSAINDRLLSQIQKHQNSYQYIGLNPSQIAFVNNMKLANTKNIKCQDIWEVLIGVKQEVSAAEVLKVFKAKVAKIWHHVEIQIIQFGEKLMRQLQLINRYKVEHFPNSKLIQTPEDQIKLTNFFGDRQLQSANLLYQSSEHGFEIQQFHKRCDHISNTVTICQTEYGKVIGAFTPHEWYKSEKWEFFKDTTGESFLFSLTHGDKFVNQNNEAGIVRRNDNTFGLQFGKNLEWDLLLANKANQNDRSLANINTGFKNRKYTKGDKASFERFIGNPEGYTFRVKEWEVWRVEFKGKQGESKGIEVGSAHRKNEPLFMINLDFESDDSDHK